MAGIFSYQLAAADVNFKQAQIPLQTVTNYSTLIKVAKAENKISDAELAILKDWHL